MQQAMVHHDVSDESEDTAFEDVEWEMCCSAREASFGLVPFANLDLTKWRWNDRTGSEGGDERMRSGQSSPTARESQRDLTGGP